MDNERQGQMIRGKMLKLGAAIAAPGIACVNTSYTVRAVETRSADIKARYTEYQQIKDVV